jgi:hypothetical protein
LKRRKQSELHNAHALTSYRALGLSPGQLLQFMEDVQKLDESGAGADEKLRSLKVLADVVSDNS